MKLNQHLILPALPGVALLAQAADQPWLTRQLTGMEVRVDGRAVRPRAAGRFAGHRFSGSWSAERAASARRKLADWIAAEKLQPIGEPLRLKFGVLQHASPEHMDPAKAAPVVSAELKAWK